MSSGISRSSRKSTREGLTPAEFDLVLQTNAYLRKMAEPLLKDSTGKDRITEDLVRKQWGMRYGEKVRIRHIQVRRPQDMNVVRRRLAAGDSFEKVALEESTLKRTAVLGGLTPPIDYTKPQTGLGGSLPRVINDAIYLYKYNDGKEELINGSPPNPDAPFGGFKMSGIGRDGGRFALATYSELKYVGWAS